MSKMFNTLKQNRGKFRHVVFSPDRMNVQIEEKLFEELNEKCFFDIDVATLTRFAERIISKHNYSFKVLTKPVAIAIIKKILNENKDEFKTIKKALNFNGFASILFDTISMFKSCNVSYDKIDTNTKNTNLNLKLEDIRLVYQKYEEFLQNEYTDSFNKLDLLAKLICSEDFSDTHFYFVGFDDFTPQMYNIISSLVKVSASVNVATAVNYIDELNNKNIYLNNVYLNLLNLANINGFNFNKIYCKQTYIDEFDVISNNLFGMQVKPQNISANHISLYKFNNIDDEIEFAIKQLQHFIVAQKLSYNDFVLVVPSMGDYKQKLQNMFITNNVPHFFDESEAISKSIVFRFYTDLFEVVASNFNKRELLNFLKYYSGLDVALLNSYENMVAKSGLNYKKLLKPIEYMYVDTLAPVYDVLNKLSVFADNLKNKATLFDVIDELIRFTEDFGFNNYLTSLILKYRAQNNVLEHNKLNNVVIKINKGLEELKQVLGGYETKYLEVFDIIKAYFENITIVMPPILSESVIVTDILKGALPKKQYAIILGMAEGKMPIVQNDLGLITDQDISLMSSKYVLSPTVNVLNKRNKFKVYETMLMYPNIVGTYVAVTKNGEAIMPSEVMMNLTTMFDNLKIVNGSLILHSYQNEFTNQYLLFNNINPAFATTNFIENLKTEQEDESVVVKENTNSIYSALLANGNSVDSYVANLDFVNNVPNITNPSVFLQTNKVSVSEIEKYYNCPFAHFVRYGLKLDEGDSAEFNARLIGNILHEYTKIIVPYMQKHRDEGLEEYSYKTLDSILAKDDYKYLVLNPNNSNEIKSLKKEVLRINTALLSLQDAESLKPEWLERNCDGFTLDNGKVQIELKGVIDRVDFDEDNFVVIDYKSGESDFKNYTDIASGNKLQLIVYVYIVSQKTNKRPIGVFYMPLKNSYTKDDNDDLYKLKGAVSQQIGDIVKIDKNLAQSGYSSKVVNLKTKVGGGINAQNKLLLSQEDFDKIVDYTIKMVLNAVEKIKSGYIAPNPLKIGSKISCKYCQFKAMCNFTEEFGNSYREVKQTKTVGELNIDAIE